MGSLGLYEINNTLRRKTNHQEETESGHLFEESQLSSLNQGRRKVFSQYEKMTILFSTVPKGALKQPIPFKVEVPKSQLDEFKVLLKCNSTPLLELIRTTDETLRRLKNPCPHVRIIARRWEIRSQSQMAHARQREMAERVRLPPNFHLMMTRT